MATKDDLADYTIYLPEFPSDIWSEELREAEGPQHELLLQQVRLVNLANNIPKRSAATPERLAWVVIWAKTLRLLDGARVCVERGNNVAIRILARPAFELSLHLWAILQPVLQWQRLKASPNIRVKGELKVPEEDWHHAASRLGAYAAWCIIGDLDLIAFLLGKKNQREIWDSKPAKELVADPELLRGHEMLFGQVEVLNDHELERDRAAWESSLRREQARLQHWLQHEGLQRWAQKYKELEQAARDGQQGGKTQTPSFFELVGQNERSVRAHLVSRGLGFAYFGYKRSSQLMHGSSLRDFSTVNRHSIIPLVTAVSDEDVSLAVKELASACVQIALSLLLLRPRVWRDEIVQDGV